MKINISTHAAKRALERGISEEGIRAIVNGDVFKVTLKSASNPEVVIYLGSYDNIMWAVMFDKRKYNVVTVRWANRKEIKYYADTRRRLRDL